MTQSKKSNTYLEQRCCASSTTTTTKVDDDYKKAIFLGFDAQDDHRISKDMR